jgi:hypothetical protein
LMFYSTEAHATSQIHSSSVESWNAKREHVPDNISNLFFCPA